MGNVTLISTPLNKTEHGTYFIQTWGCQMNEEDSEQIALFLKEIGFKSTENLRSAHVILLNTCSVRKKPEDKAFSMLGELRLLKQTRPEIILGVCGCMAQLRAKEIHQRAPHVDFVVGTAQISQIPGLIQESLQKRSFQKRMELPERKGNIVTELPIRKTNQVNKFKSFVSIQYGCDKMCTYCIVPITRGRERSRPTAEIIAEVQTLATQGTKEITLLGQTVNSYGKNLSEGRVPFSRLLRMLSAIEGIERIRYISPYPRDFKTDLIETIRDIPAVMEHVHLPLQAGDDEVLKNMKRVYTRDSFLQIVKELRFTIPKVSITTDIIVASPGETDEQFQNTLDMIRKVRFDNAFMFMYSPRPHTPAALLENQIPQSIKYDRLKELMALQNQITQEIHESLVGKTVEVLLESSVLKLPGYLKGYSRDFKNVRVEAPKELLGHTVQVKITNAHLWGLTGNILL